MRDCHQSRRRFLSWAVSQNFDPDYIRFALEKSLERLRTDYIDIYQLHNPPLMMLERGTHYAVLDELKQEGKIRYYGVSVHDAYEGTMAIATGKPDVIQVAYNFLRQDPREDLFPFAQEHDIGLIIREPLANGMLTGKYTATTTFGEGDMRTEWPPEFLALQARLADKARFLVTLNAPWPRRRYVSSSMPRPSLSSSLG